MFFNIIFYGREAEYKFKERYNPKSNRLQNYDYSANGRYFITICTKDRENYFWEIVDWKMILNEIWWIVENEILNIWIFRENVIIDEYMVMPNHVHFVLILDNNECRDVLPKRLYENENNNYNNNFSKISPKKWTIWNIMKLFKWFTTKTINKSQNEIFFAWQTNYYDRIIRDEDELSRIRKYIDENPEKWEQDKDNEENLYM